MGVHREFNFQDDIELLNLKYQMDNGNFADYFQDNEIPDLANEKKKIEIEKPRHQL